MCDCPFGIYTPKKKHLGAYYYIIFTAARAILLKTSVTHHITLLLTPWPPPGFVQV